MATSCAEQGQLMVFLKKIEALVGEGFKGAITLQCPGDTTVRSMEVRQYLDLEQLKEEHDER